jgi:hypothetical protein
VSRHARRDFLNGEALAAGGATLVTARNSLGSGFFGYEIVEGRVNSYPPALTGLARLAPNG